MKIRFRTFNIYFLWAAFLALAVSVGALGDKDLPTTVAPGVRSDSKAKEKAPEVPKKKKKKKVISTVRVHLEATRDGTDRITTIQVLRSNPIQLHIDREPIVTEAYLADARVVAALGGSEIELTFNSQGRTLLENYTAANRGRRIAIYSDFDKEHRWLAAPVVTRLISNGVLRFAPEGLW